MIIWTNHKVIIWVGDNDQHQIEELVIIYFYVSWYVGLRIEWEKE